MNTEGNPILGRGDSMRGFTTSTSRKNVSALSTSKLANQAPPKMQSPEMSTETESYPVDKLLAKLSEQNANIPRQSETLKRGESERAAAAQQYSSNSLPVTPAIEEFPLMTPSARPASADTEDNRAEADELMRLKLQLAQAHNQISHLEQATSRASQSDQGPSSTEPFPKMESPRDALWGQTEDGQSDNSDIHSGNTFSRARGFWNNSQGTFAGFHAQAPASEHAAGGWLGGRGFNHGLAESTAPMFNTVHEQRSDRLGPDTEYLMRGVRRPARFDPSRTTSPQYGGPFNLYNPPAGQYEGMLHAGVSPNQVAGGNMQGRLGLGSASAGMYTHAQQPFDTPLSPYASEFTSQTPWKTETMSNEGPMYLPTTEPLNYRRLLDRNVNCNWKYIVDKIVCNNDQQASIFLQQKLKVGTPEQKYEIVEAIVAQAYPLMVNRFGNFLVQRCFEHGTPEQVIKIAEAIRGNTLSLSMDPFGCHVVQKAFDSVPEDYKAIMVHELLRRIPETVIHRYACHVWQKLFELRWTETPPQIMKYVNEALRGMWHEVALGETGSLVVQNIFENCLEDDKRPCIEEVLANIDIVAHGQFGNWCIQHVCEHGAPPDRSRAIDHVIRYAAEYSTDQFASKVVEKCLKIGGGEFLGRYLDRVCEGRRDRTRIPLIDIASDQYGNYLVQWILNNASPQHREVVAAHIRKHMVSLRGSKFGSRVGMLCTNHAVTTRPGPGVGPGMGGGRMGPVARFGGSNTYR